MELKILIVKVAEENFAIDLVTVPTPRNMGTENEAEATIREMGESASMRLQHGYRTPKQALQALFDCLAFAPPDLETYDEAVGQVSGLLDAVATANDAIQQLGDRVNSVEDQIAGAFAVGLKKENPLLARRPAGPPPREERPQHAAPPAIRRQTLGHGTHSGDIVGGVSRGPGSRRTGEDDNG